MASEVAVEKRYEVDIRDLECQREGGESILARLYRTVGRSGSAGPTPIALQHYRLVGDLERTVPDHP